MSFGSSLNLLFEKANKNERRRPMKKTTGGQTGTIPWSFFRLELALIFALFVWEKIRRSRLRIEMIIHRLTDKITLYSRI